MLHEKGNYIVCMGLYHPVNRVDYTPDRPIFGFAMSQPVISAGFDPLGLVDCNVL